MAARAKKLGLLVAALVAAQVIGHAHARQPQGTAPQAGTGRTAAVRRIVSLVPSLTESLFAIGAGPQVVGVGTFDSFPPEVKALPKVGALLDPNTERILALKPDLIITYGSQTDAEAQFAKAGIRTYSYRHGGITTILDNIRELGVLTGHQSQADAVVARIRSRLDALRARVKDRPRPKTLLVIERQPKTLRDIYASGGVGFLHEMIEIAGGRNVFADEPREAVQPSTEVLLTRAPEVIVEVRASGLIEPSEVRTEQNVWAALASLPAVRNRRIHFVVGDQLVVPGPRLADGAEMLARTLHPEVFGR